MSSVERGHAPKFKIEYGGLFEDLPRSKDGTAIIADPRNDENLVLAGLHAAFLLFHNKAVDLMGEHDHRASPGEVFRQARQLTTWHYQWMILHEFLPLFVGQALVNDILSQRTEILPAGGGVHARRVPGRSVPLWSHSGAPLVPGESGG